LELKSQEDKLKIKTRESPKVQFWFFVFQKKRKSFNSEELPAELNCVFRNNKEINFSDFQ